MSTTKRTIAVSVVAVSALTILGGCAYHEPRTVPAATVPIYVPAASPPTTVVIPQQTTAATRVAYPNGAYELRGAGTLGSPYYWVGVPAGVQSPLLPAPPPLPPAR